MKKHLISLVICLATCITTQGQIYSTATVVPDGGLTSNANCIFREPGGYIWAGTSDGLVRIAHQSFRTYKADGSENALPGNNVLAISADASGVIHILTDKGAVKYDKSRDSFNHIDSFDFQQKGNAPAGSIITDTGGTLTGTKFGGIVSIRETGIRSYMVSNELISGHKESVSAIRQGPAADEIIIKTTEGCYLFNTKTENASHTSSIEISNAEPLVNWKNIIPDSLQVRAYTINNYGDYWLATDKGIAYLNPDTHQISLIPTKLYNRAEAIVCDSKGKVWIGTDNGLAAYSSNDQNFTFFGASYGASEGQYSPDAAILCRNGKVVLGGSFGFTIIDPAIANRQSENPVIEVADIIIDGKRIPTISRVILSQNQKSFVLNILAREDEILREKQYKFRLKGGAYGKGYEIVTDEPTINPAFIRLDTYTIEAACSTINGDWTDYQQLLTLKLRPKWYNIRLLYFLAILGAIALTDFIVRKRLAKAKIDTGTDDAEGNNGGPKVEWVEATDNIKSGKTDQTPKPDPKPTPDPKPEQDTKNETMEPESFENLEPLDPVVHLSDATILAVDDDLELIEFIAEELQSFAGRVITASNGIEALEILKKENVDIIVSDVMMPQMDGFELCKKVKTSIEISHIPVVLLTARSDEKSRETGYKNGADDYVVKPFDTENLVEILNRLLKNRETMRRRFNAGSGAPDIKEATFSSADEDFFRQLDEIIMKNITDPELSTHLICKDMDMSRTLLYNKIRNLAGMSIKDYITKVRMDYAVKLLTETEMPVQEISEKCGYTTSRYFSTAFKGYTGKTPTEYRH